MGILTPSNSDSNNGKRIPLLAMGALAFGMAGAPKPAEAADVNVLAVSEETNQVDLVDADTRAWISTLTVDGGSSARADAIVVDPDSNSIFIGNNQGTSNTVTEYYDPLNSTSADSQVSIAGDITGLILNNGKLIAVTNDGYVSSIDRDTMTLNGETDVGGENFGGVTAIDDNTVAVTDYDNDQVHIVDISTATPSVTASYDMSGVGAANIKYDSSSGYLIVTGVDNNTVSFVDPSTGSIDSTISNPVSSSGGGPWALSVSETTGNLWVGDDYTSTPDNDIAIYEDSDGDWIQDSLVTNLAIGETPRFTEQDGYMHVGAGVNSSGAELTVVDASTYATAEEVDLDASVTFSGDPRTIAAGTLDDGTTTAPTDTDGDGITDADDAFPTDATEWADSDVDGYGDNGDDFPYDSNEWDDIDGDGYGDNFADAFPTDSTEWADSDADGYGDNYADAFPTDTTEWTDSDGDGYGDNAADAFPTDSAEWADSDDDTYGDNADCDDTNAAVNPGATETTGNGLDDDCDPTTSDTVTEPDYDADNDGHDALVYGGDDCDDSDPDAYPGATDSLTLEDVSDLNCDGAEDAIWISQQTGTFEIVVTTSDTYNSIWISAPANEGDSMEWERTNPDWDISQGADTGLSLGALGTWTNVENIGEGIIKITVVEPTIGIVSYSSELPVSARSLGQEGTELALTLDQIGETAEIDTVNDTITVDPDGSGSGEPDDAVNYDGTPIEQDTGDDTGIIDTDDTGPIDTDTDTDPKETGNTDDTSVDDTADSDTNDGNEQDTGEGTPTCGCAETPEGKGPLGSTLIAFGTALLATLRGRSGKKTK